MEIFGDPQWGTDWSLVFGVDQEGLGYFNEDEAIAEAKRLAAAEEVTKVEKTYLRYAPAPDTDKKIFQVWKEIPPREFR